MNCGGRASLPAGGGVGEGWGVLVMRGRSGYTVDLRSPMNLVRTSAFRVFTDRPGRQPFHTALAGWGGGLHRMRSLILEPVEKARGRDRLWSA